MPCDVFDLLSNVFWWYFIFYVMGLGSAFFVLQKNSSKVCHSTCVLSYSLLWLHEQDLPATQPYQWR